MRVIIGVLVIVLFSFMFACQSTSGDKSTESARLFKTYCVNCHGIDGSLMTNGAKDLRFSVLSMDERILVITQGRNAMTSFGNTLTAKQIHTLAEYTIQLTDPLMNAK